MQCSASVRSVSIFSMYQSFCFSPYRFAILTASRFSCLNCSTFFRKCKHKSPIKGTFMLVHQPTAALVPFMGLYPCYNTVTKKKQLPKVTAARRKEMMKNEKNRCKRRRYYYGSPAYLPGRLGRNVADFRHHQPAGDLSKQASAKKPPEGGFFVFGLTKTIR